MSSKSRDPSATVSPFGLKHEFHVYEHKIQKNRELSTYRMIVLKNREGRIVCFTGLEQFSYPYSGQKPKIKVRQKQELHYICKALNHIFLFNRIDKISDISAEMVFQGKQIWLPCIQNWQVNGTMIEMIPYDLNTLLNILVEKYGGNARTVVKAGKQQSLVEQRDVDALTILAVGLFQEKQIWLPCIQNWQANGTMKEIILYDLNTLLNVLVERYGGNVRTADKVGKQQLPIVLIENTVHTI